MTQEPKNQVSGGTALELPTNTCAYERFDPKTLEPVNKETYIRLQELGWSKQDFAGRTVLDVGCNSGLLTLHALHLGAATVHACDVQPPLVEFVSQVVQAHRLPVKVECLAFGKLRPAEHKADIVLFMEVLHWAVSQGLELRDVIRRLADLTEHLLYIEFPWSVREPSIQAQTKLTEETYSADAVLDELTRYFSDVRVVRFMRYFGFASPSQRILIEARGKRPEAGILTLLPNTYSLDVPLSRGQNESYLLTDAEGPLVAKLLARESSITRLPVDLRNQMFDELNAGQPKALVAPRRHAGNYLLPADGGRFWMLFPFIGRFPSAFGRTPTYSVQFDPLIALFLQVRRDFRPLTTALLERLRQHQVFLGVRSVAASESVWRKSPGELGPLPAGLEKAMSDLQARDLRTFDALCHGDLQTGNFVLDDKGIPRVIDLDNLRVGTIYSDGLTGLIWRGAPAETLASFCQQLAAEESRPVAPYDVHLAMANGLAWFAVAFPRLSGELDEQIVRLRQGIAAAGQFAAGLG